jgi:hypothetical protein
MKKMTDDSCLAWQMVLAMQLANMPADSLLLQKDKFIFMHEGEY